MIGNLVLTRCISSIGAVVLLLTSISCFAPSDNSRINEIKATQTLLSIREAQKVFKAKFGTYGTLQDLTDGKLLDPTLINGDKDGYKFEITLSENKYKALATPQRFKTTGVWAYYLDETGVIRGASKDGVTVGPSDYPINTQ